jgi:hypothetical protein
LASRGDVAVVPSNSTSSSPVASGFQPFPGVVGGNAGEEKEYWMSYDTVDLKSTSFGGPLKVYIYYNRQNLDSHSAHPLQKDANSFPLHL